MKDDTMFIAKVNALLSDEASAIRQMGVLNRLVAHLE